MDCVVVESRKKVDGAKGTSYARYLCCLAPAYDIGSLFIHRDVSTRHVVFDYFNIAFLVLA